MSNMTVSVTLRLQDQFTGPVRALIQQFQGLTRAAQDFNRAAGGAGSSSGFGRMQGQVRAVANEVRNLAGQFSGLARSIATPTGGGTFAQRQISDMRQLIQLQQQAIANNQRMLAGPSGPVGPRAPAAPASPPGFFGRRGFSPNSSLQDRMQYRGVNLLESTLASGALDYDRVRTQLQMFTVPRHENDDPNRPQMAPVLTQQDLLRAESEARQYSQIFRSLSPAHILETFREIMTQFRSSEEAFAFLPELLRIQDFQVLGGDTLERARDGMLRLLRGVGLSGRLIGPEGELTLDQSRGFLEAYLRARMIGGADVTPDQAFQMVKYLKTTGQTLSTEALLEGFIAMPDIRASTYGHQTDMLIRQLTGRATQAAQRAMVAGGLGAITQREASGPHSFQVVDEELLRTHPGAWIQQHIVGPTGFLRRSGIDPIRATPAAIATALRPLFSNQSAENIANMVVNQRAEWLNQVQNALRINLTEDARVGAARGSLWHGLVSARSQIMNSLGTIADNFKSILLPPIQLVASGLQKLGELVDPRTGNQLISQGLLGAGMMGLMFLPRLLRGMGGLGRTLLGGGLGIAFGGGITEALMGALLLRGMGGTAGALATGAAGAAATAAGMTLGRRLLAGLLAIWRGLPKFLFIGAVISGIGAIADNWEAIKPRILAVWEELKQAAPPWLGGQGRGWNAFTQGPAITSLNTDLDTWLRSTEASIQEWARGTALGQWLHAQGWTNRAQEIARLDAQARAMAPLFQAPPDATSRAHGKGSVQTLTTGPINVTVNVAQTNADPQTIGDAAGNAVRSRLRGLLGDSGESVPYGH